MTGQRLTRPSAHLLNRLLTDRDLDIIHSLTNARVLTGAQLTRLHFFDLSPSTQDRTRCRVLQRLTDMRVVDRLDRTIGGVRAGSTGWVFSLGPAGQQWVQLNVEHRTGRIRKPWTPSLLFLAHSLAVAEVYVQLVEASRAGSVGLNSFETEPVCWWPDGLGGFLKPDAYLVLSGSHYDELVWLEVDRATESLPTLKRKLASYLDFIHRGQLGPSGVMPHVVISTPHQRRADAVQALIDGLTGASELFRVTTEELVCSAIVGLAVETTDIAS